MHLPPEEGLVARVQRLHPRVGADASGVLQARAEGPLALQEAGPLLLGGVEVHGGPTVHAAEAEEAEDEGEEEGCREAQPKKGSRLLCSLPVAASAEPGRRTSGATLVAIPTPSIEASESIPGEEHEQPTRGLRGLLGRQRRGGLSSAAARIPLEFEELVQRDAPPADFRVTLQLAGARSQSTALSLPLAAGADGGEEAARLRARINNLSKKAAHERRSYEAAIRELKVASKSASREVYRSLERMESNVQHVTLKNKKVLKLFTFWRKKAYELEKQAAEREARLRDARADNEINLRRAREAESLAERREQLLEKSNERRAVTMAYHKNQSATIKVSEHAAAEANREAAQRRRQLQEADKELGHLRQQMNELLEMSREGEGEGEDDEAAAAEEEDMRSHREAERCEQDNAELADLAASLAGQLAESREKVLKLELEIDSRAKFVPPQFIAKESETSERSKRRRTQVDVAYLEEVFKKRPWEGCDLARALESAGLLAEVFDSRQVRA